MKIKMVYEFDSEKEALDFLGDRVTATPTEKKKPTKKKEEKKEEKKSEEKEEKKSEEKEEKKGKEKKGKDPEKVAEKLRNKIRSWAQERDEDGESLLKHRMKILKDANPTKEKKSITDMDLEEVQETCVNLAKTTRDDESHAFDFEG